MPERCWFASCTSTDAPHRFQDRAPAPDGLLVTVEGRLCDEHHGILARSCGDYSFGLRPNPYEETPPCPG